MDKDPNLSEAQNAALDEEIKKLMKQGYSRYRAEEMAPFLLGLSDGDVIEEPIQS